VLKLMSFAEAGTDPMSDPGRQIDTETAREERLIGLCRRLDPGAVLLVIELAERLRTEQDTLIPPRLPPADEG
jgi:hypothetical protein